MLFKKYNSADAVCGAAVLVTRGKLNICCINMKLCKVTEYCYEQVVSPWSCSWLNQWGLALMTCARALAIRDVPFKVFNFL